MNYCKVVVIMNITDYGLINTAIHVPGVTVSMVKGFGDYINTFNDFGLSDNMKIEIYTSEQQAEEVASTFTTIANDLTEGGGIVAIEPVKQLYNVRKLDSQ